MLSIDSIGLSNRSKNALHRAEIHTVGDMLVHTEESLNEIRNLGKKSIEEILIKIDEYRKFDEKKRDSGSEQIIAQEAAPEELEEWIKEDTRKEFVRAWLLEKKVKIRDLEFLSVRAFNILLFSDYDYLHQIVFMSEEELMKIPRMDDSSAGEIVRRCNYYLKNIKTIKIGFIVNSAIYIVYFLAIWDFSSTIIETITALIGLISLFKLVFYDSKENDDAKSIGDEGY